MYSVIRPVLFRLDPERAHEWSLRLMNLVGRLPALRWGLRSLFRVENKPIEVFGLTFPNPVGIAAGYDKDGQAFRGLSALGAGHVEIGTVTPMPQAGNPRPRIFRLPDDEALINRMGFPGRGMDAVLQHVAGPRPQDLVLGVNIGKNKDTPNLEAVEDYLALLRGFAPEADYIAINVSSPNTVGLRELQGGDALRALLSVCIKERDQLRARLDKPLPLLVKLAPDLDDQELDEALDAVLQSGIDGVIATNTTVERPELRSSHKGETGGLSGRPLSAMSTEMIEEIFRRTDGALPIIGVGGIMSPEDARKKFQAGASLVQVYTGLVYRGPGLIRDIAVGC